MQNLVGRVVRFPVRAGGIQAAIAIQHFPDAHVEMHFGVYVGRENGRALIRDLGAKEPSFRFVPLIGWLYSA